MTMSTTKTQTASSDLVTTDLMSLTFVAVLGAAVLFVAGFANAEALHNSTHDSRHVAGFPCH